MNVIDNNNKRCCLCDYCIVSHPFEEPRTFVKAHGRDDYVCFLCLEYVKEALRDFQGDDTQDQEDPVDDDDTLPYPEECL